MKIAIACDHGGFALKSQIQDYLISQGHNVVDFGTNNTDSCDYPDYARPCAQAVANGSCERGVVICTTGIGVSIVANKVKGIRCALCTNTDVASFCRMHNNANVVAMGAKYTDLDTAKQIVDIFLSTPFEGGRHQRRVDKIEQ